VVLPRKIAATSLAKRVAEELGCYNYEIAHKVRFNATVNDNTRVVFMTDGTLVQELYSSPLLQEYSAIILDDVHERSINYDILFSFIKRILQRRQDLKLIVTSATIDNDALLSFFSLNRDYKKGNRQLKIKSVNITGRLHEVAVHYLKDASKNYFLKIFQTVVYIDREKPPGEVLVFLTSVEEIEGMAHMLDSYMVENKRRLKVLPLHSKMSPEDQNLIFERTYDRKVILATNIAESSLTIPDIRFVVDCGYVKVKMFDWEAGIDKMIVVPCGKSSANQRAGRAGRVNDGECFRAYPEAGFNTMADRLPPEILRVDLSNFILKLKGLGIEDVVAF
jgi:ATP-dependent RNA helicase DDX35